MRKASKTRFAILGMLSIQPMSGYEIKQAMKNSTGYFWAESDGQLYPTIAQLLDEELIAHKNQKLVNSREKKTLKITNQGLKELKKWLSLKAETQNTRNEFLLKMFFAANMSHETALEHVAVYRYQQKNALKELEAIKQQINVNAHDHPDHLPFWLLTLEYGLKVGEAEVAWCNQVMDYLENTKT